MNIFPKSISIDMEKAGIYDDELGEIVESLDLPVISIDVISGVLDTLNMQCLEIISNKVKKVTIIDDIDEE
jgi:hypothetical protein